MSSNTERKKLNMNPGSSNTQRKKLNMKPGSSNTQRKKLNMNPGSNSRSNSHNKNIIDANCTIHGNSTVGDNSGNSKNNHNIGHSNTIRGGRNVIDKDINGISVVGHKSGNAIIEIQKVIVGDNKGNRPAFKREIADCNCKNKIEEHKCFREYYIVGDNSGNIDGNPNGGGGDDSVSDSLKEGFDWKNVIRKKTKIEGNSIVGDNSGNSGKIDDIPNGGGNNSLNNLLQATSNYKNAIEAETQIEGKSIIGDGSGNNELVGLESNKNHHKKGQRQQQHQQRRRHHQRR